MRMSGAIFCTVIRMKQFHQLNSSITLGNRYEMNERDLYDNGDDVVGIQHARRAVKRRKK